MSCITTYTKHHIDPTNARPEDIDIRDIAHALSLLCRAGGHFPTFYSVAQHCLNCAAEAAARGYSRRVQAGCLLHDAGEAYLADITRPVKEQLPTYRDIEDRLLKQILDAYISPALSEEELEQIFAVDDTLLYHEFFSLMGQRLFNKEPPLYSRPDLSEAPFREVEKRYLSRFNALTKERPAFTVGVDRMNGCWLAAEWRDGYATCHTYENISALCATYPDVAEIVIDVPIGLPDTAAESDKRPDLAARHYLTPAPRKSCVFPAPLRSVAYAATTAAMWDTNRSLGGSLSVAGTGILPIIREVDSFLQKTPSWRYRLVESHPECAFQALNGGVGLDYSKHKPEGIRQRTCILTPYVHNLTELLTEYSVKQHNDILDALVLAVTSHLGHHPIGDTTFTDSTGLPMRIVIPAI